MTGSSGKSASVAVDSSRRRQIVRVTWNNAPAQTISSDRWKTNLKNPWSEENLKTKRWKGPFWPILDLGGQIASRPRTTCDLSSQPQKWAFLAFSPKPFWDFDQIIGFRSRFFSSIMIPDSGENPTQIWGNGCIGPFLGANWRYFFVNWR